MVLVRICLRNGNCKLQHKINKRIVECLAEEWIRCKFSDYKYLSQGEREG